LKKKKKKKKMEGIQHTGEEMKNIQIQPLEPVVHHIRHSYYYEEPQFPSPATQSFIKKTWEIEKELNLIFSNISNIQSIQTQITIATSKKQEFSLISSRDTIMNQTRSLLNTTKNKIKSFERQNLKTIKFSTTEDIEFRNQRINHLKDKFINCLETYKNIENNYMKQQKERLGRQFRIVNPNAGNDDIEEYLKTPTDHVFLKSLLDPFNKNLEDSKQVLEEVNKRHTDIKKIEKTIGELVELFKEMQLQVDLQEDFIVQISNDMQTVENTTREVTVELAQAEVSAKSARKYKRILALITLLIIGIIILIVFLIINNNRGNKRNHDGDDRRGGFRD